ncbi:hypothetical protein RI367_008059 [Sorochytrium milnesiophthora]
MYSGAWAPKNDVATRARKGREQRQDAKRREEAQQTIARAWRAHLQLLRNYAAALQDWDQQAGFLAHTDSNGDDDDLDQNSLKVVSTSMTTRQLLLLSKRLAYLRRKRQEEYSTDRFGHLVCMWVSPSIDIGSLATDTATTATRAWNISALADLCQQFLDSMWRNKTTRHANELRFLMRVLDPKSWWRTADDARLRQRGVSDLHSTLVDRGVMQQLGGQLRAQLVPARSSTAKMWLNVVVRFATFGVAAVQQDQQTSQVDKVAAHITAHLLSVPHLLAESDSVVMLMLHKAGFPALATDCICRSTSAFAQLTAISADDALFIAAHLVQLHRRSTGHPPAAPLVHALHNLLSRCTKSADTPATSPSTNMRFHPVFHWSAGGAGASVHLRQRDYDTAMEQLQHTWSTGFVKEAFGHALRLAQLSPRLIQQDLAQNALGLAEAIEASKLYLTLKRTLLSASSGVATCVAFVPGLVAALYSVLVNAGQPVGNFLIFTKAAASATPELEPLLPVLELFCESCSILLLTLTDMEIYEKQRPLSLAQLSDLTRYLCAVLYQAYWHSTHSRIASVVAAAKRLLHQLCDRHARRPFDTGLNLELPETTKKAFSKLALQERDPRVISILSNIPQCVPFALRVQLFQEMLAADRRTRVDETFVIQVRRGSALLGDGYTALNRLSGAQFKQTIRVMFVSEFGLKEAGIDQSGVFKEFLEQILKAAFDPDLGLFAATPNATLVPSVSSHVQADHLKIFGFVGKMLAKALYQGIVVDVPFAMYFWGKLLGRYSTLDELSEFDSTLYKNLEFLKHYEGDVEDLCLTFTYQEQVLGQVVDREIVADGASVAVTNDNRIQYIYLVADHRLNRSIQEQSEAFVRGFQSVIPPAWLGIFSPRELQRLICGDDAEIDLADLRRHTQYDSGYFDSHPVIVKFWGELAKFSAKEKQMFLRFCTSCSKSPLQGFKDLQPPFTIQYVSAVEEDQTSARLASSQRSGLFGGYLGSFLGLGKDMGRLPTAATCTNRLKLPAYKSRSTLRERLKYAITYGAGFDLS